MGGGGKMKTLIVYNSVHHGNTEKVAKVMSDVLEAKLVKPQELDINTIVEYDLVGFGSGIYMGKHHESLFKLADALPIFKNKNAFIFNTSGKGKTDYNNTLKEKLQKKGFNFIGDFSCNGFDTWGPFKLVGGINKGKPDRRDLDQAEKFAAELKDKKYQLKKGEKSTQRNERRF